MTTTVSCLFTPPVFSSLLSAPLVTPRSTDLLFTGLTFLIATIVGIETGPRVGKPSMAAMFLLPAGIREIFGSPAAATSKLPDLASSNTESAIEIVCT